MVLSSRGSNATTTGTDLTNVTNYLRRNLRRHSLAFSVVALFHGLSQWSAKQYSQLGPSVPCWHMHFIFVFEIIGPGTSSSPTGTQWVACPLHWHLKCDTKTWQNVYSHAFSYILKYVHCAICIPNWRRPGGGQLIPGPEKEAWGILGSKQWIHCNEKILCNGNSLQWKVCNENNEILLLKFIIFCLKLEILWKNYTTKWIKSLGVSLF